MIPGQMTRTGAYIIISSEIDGENIEKFKFG